MGKKGKYTEAEIKGFLQEIANGKPVKELGIEHGISTATIYHWRGERMRKSKEKRNVEQMFIGGDNGHSSNGNGESKASINKKAKIRIAQQDQLITKLEIELSHYKTIVAELTLENLILKGRTNKK